MSFRPEPPFAHGQPQQVGVLLVNLGTPAAATPAALRTYLGQFLSDPRVIEIPRLAWWLILHGIILRTRPAKSAAKYASIWTRDGSPLRVWTEKQAKLLTGYLGERGHRVVVRHAMRYGEPSIASQLDALKAAGATRVLVLPLYPQYCAATTGSALDEVFQWARATRSVPELRTINHFHDDSNYIDALARSVTRHWMVEGNAQKLVMSFHGMPRRTLDLGDPYHCECHKTARLLAERLGLSPKDYVVTFQSRFGKAKWLEPYTEPTLRKLARAGVKRVDVICPGFVADCIETLEEIAIEGKQAFLQAGGQHFHYIPCLNDNSYGMDALSALVIRHLQGWPTQALTVAEQAGAQADLQAQLQRAQHLGAPR
jgi:ferrochelatase